MTRIARQAHLERDYSKVKPERLKALGIRQPVGVWTPENEAVIECEVTGNCVSYYELVSDFHVPGKEEIKANCERFREEWEEDRRDSDRYEKLPADRIGGRHYCIKFTGTPYKGNEYPSSKELSITFIE